MYLFSTPQNKGPWCLLNIDAHLECSTGQVIALSSIADLQQWMHLTYVANANDANSKLYLDYGTI